MPRPRVCRSVRAECGPASPAEPRRAPVNPVAMKPGAITLTVMLREATSSAKRPGKADDPRLRRSVIALAGIPPSWPTTEAMLMIRPLRAGSCRAARLTQPIERGQIGIEHLVPFLPSRMRSSRLSRVTPALLTRDRGRRPALHVIEHRRHGALSRTSRHETAVGDAEALGDGRRPRGGSSPCRDARAARRELGHQSPRRAPRDAR